MTDHHEAAHSTVGMAAPRRSIQHREGQDHAYPDGDLPLPTEGIHPEAFSCSGSPHPLARAASMKGRDFSYGSTSLAL